jgi:site-specific recombinase XerD
MKTEIRVDVPLLSPALAILDKYKDHPAANQRQEIFPYTFNQEVNRQLKLIAEAAGIKKHLTFHLARHTFDTLLLMNGVPIETIKKLLGHTKITTTMIYAHVVNAKVGLDREAFERKMDLKQNKESDFQ